MIYIRLVPVKVRLLSLGLDECISTISSMRRGTQDFDEELCRANVCEKGQVCRGSSPLLTHLCSSHGQLLDPLDLNSDPYNRSVDV